MDHQIFEVNRPDTLGDDGLSVKYTPLSSYEHPLFVINPNGGGPMPDMPDYDFYPRGSTIQEIAQRRKESEDPDAWKEKAFAEYDKFNKTQKIESDFDKAVKSLQNKK